MMGKIKERMGGDICYQTEDRQKPTGFAKKSFSKINVIQVRENKQVLLTRWFKPLPSYPQTLEVTNNLKGPVFTIPKFY